MPPMMGPRWVPGVGWMAAPHPAAAMMMMMYPPPPGGYGGPPRARSPPPGGGPIITDYYDTFPRRPGNNLLHTYVTSKNKII